MSLIFLTRKAGPQVVLNPKNYGAKGNGTTNDTAAFQACINDAFARHLSIAVPAGTYLADVTWKERVNGQGHAQADTWIKGRVKPASFSTLSDLKMGRAGHIAWGWTNSDGAVVTHDAILRRCRFTGGPTWGTGGEFAVLQLAGACFTAYDLLFEDCVIEKSTNRCNGVLLEYYGLDDATYHNLLCNIEFLRLAIEGATRIAWELTVPDAGTALHPIVAPYHDIDLIDYDILGSDNSAVSYCGRPSGAADAGLYEMGHGIIRGRVRDAAIVGTGGVGNHGIELNGVAYMDVNHNLIQGTHQRTMLCTSAGTTRPLQNTHNSITDNTFDGTLSPLSAMDIGGGGLTYSRNVAKTRAGNSTMIRRCQESVFEADDFRAVNADGTLSTTHQAVCILNTDHLTLRSTFFRSKFSRTVELTDNWGSGPTKAATDIAFVNDTFVKDPTDARILVGANCTKTEVGSVDQTA